MAANEWVGSAGWRDVLLLRELSGAPPAAGTRGVRTLGTDQPDVPAHSPFRPAGWAACPRAHVPSFPPAIQPLWKEGTTMSTIQEQNTNTSQAAAEIPQPSPKLTPEAVVEQLRALRGQIGEVSQLTPQQRRALRQQVKVPDAVLQSSINTIGVMGSVASAVGQPAEDVRGLHAEAARWTAVEDELRAMLNGVAGANLVRRQRVVLVAAQAFGVSQLLARDPANADLVPHVQEIKRLKRVARHKKSAQPPVEQPPATPQQSPAPVPPVTPPSSHNV